MPTWANIPSRTRTVAFFSAIVTALTFFGPAEAIAEANIPALPENALNAQSKFGATGDGTTNDTKALQSAIDACPPAIKNNAKDGVGVWVGDQTISGNDITQNQNGYIVYGGSANGQDMVNGADVGPSHG